ncbi:MAG: type IV pili methyl-accepting chemotaxis transducer N-terminal domain-containing protein, partial [Clostridia bacterium]
MAFKLAIKLPFGGAAKKEAAAAAGPSSVMGSPLPLLGKMAFGRQLRILTSVLVVLLLADGATVVYDAYRGTVSTAYIATVGKIRMLSQRLAKAAQQASQGNREAFKQLKASRDEFDQAIKVLLAGGDAGGTTVPATSGEARPALEKLDGQWKRTDANASLVIGEERNLVALGEAVRSINANNPTLAELADEISALSVQSNGSARQNAITGQLVMLTQRMAKNANTMLASDVVDPEVA